MYLQVPVIGTDMIRSETLKEEMLSKIAKILFENKHVLFM